MAPWQWHFPSTVIELKYKQPSLALFYEYDLWSSLKWPWPFFFSVRDEGLDDEADDG